MVCDHCGHPVTVGDWPWCPHGRPRFGIQTDEAFIGGKTFEHLGHDPVTVYSRGELKRELDARGLEPFVRHQPRPGTDKSPHTELWSTPDAQTLKNAQALLSRSQARTNRHIPHGGSDVDTS